MRTDIDQVSGGRVEPAACSTPQGGRLFAQHHPEPAVAQSDRASEPGETTPDKHDIFFHADTRPKCTTHDRLSPPARCGDIPGKPSLLLNKARHSCLLRQIAADRR